MNYCRYYKDLCIVLFASASYLTDNVEVSTMLPVSTNDNPGKSSRKNEVTESTLNPTSFEPNLVSTKKIQGNFEFNISSF